MLIQKSFSSPDSTPFISPPLVSVPFSFSDFSSNSHFPFKLLSKPQNKVKEKHLERCWFPPWFLSHEHAEDISRELPSLLPIPNPSVLQWGTVPNTAGTGTDPCGTDGSPQFHAGYFSLTHLLCKFMQAHWIDPDFQLLCKVSRRKGRKIPTPCSPVLLCMQNLSAQRCWAPLPYFYPSHSSTKNTPGFQARPCCDPSEHAGIAAACPSVAVPMLCWAPGAMCTCLWCYQGEKMPTILWKSKALPLIGSVEISRCGFARTLEKDLRKLKNCVLLWLLLMVFPIMLMLDTGGSFRQWHLRFSYGYRNRWPPLQRQEIWSPCKPCATRVVPGTQCCSSRTELCQVLCKTWAKVNPHLQELPN